MENNLKNDLLALKMVVKRELSQLEKEPASSTDSDDLFHKSLWMKQIADSLRTIPDKDTIHKVSSITIKNIHTAIDENIQLNPKMSIDDNAALLEKKSKKLGEKAATDKQNNATASARRAFLLETFETLKSLNFKNSPPETIEETLVALKKKLSDTTTSIAEKPLHQDSTLNSPFRQFSSKGYLILAGKTDEQNDALSTRYTANNDLWFHAAHCAGSHVVIKLPKGVESPDQETINHAAAIAAWFSKARNSPSADVHFTEGRYVHKRKNAPRGEVMLEKFRTLKIRPESPDSLFKN